LNIDYVGNSVSVIVTRTYTTQKNGSSTKNKILKIKEYILIH